MKSLFFLWQFILQKRPRFIWLLFYPLLFLGEIFYRAGFFVWKKTCFLRTKGYQPSGFFVIGVGNIAVGGIGKTAVVRFLVELLGSDTCAVIMRGYGGTNESTKESFCVNEQFSMQELVFVCGDEAVMLAQLTQVIVVVGSKREKNIKYLEAKKSHLKSIVIDDAYQNASVKKNLEILLLDARAPFGNEHYLPMGPLREKDVSRADVVIFTHSKNLPSQAYYDHMAMLKRRGFSGELFYGTYEFSGFIDRTGNMHPFLPKNAKVFIFAGVGSFTGFLESVKNLDLHICGQREFIDHMVYTEQVMREILLHFNKIGADFLITTMKDLVKINKIMEKLDSSIKIPVYALDVKFAFIDNKEMPNSFVDFVIARKNIFLESYSKKNQDICI